MGDNDTDTAKGNVDLQTAPSLLNPGTVRDAAHRLASSLSRFSQDGAGNQSTLIAILKQAGEHPTDSGSTPRQNPGQASAPGSNFSEVYGLAQKLHAGAARLTQDAQRNQESPVALIKRLSQQLRGTEAKVYENRAQIEKLGTWIHNNRS